MIGAVNEPGDGPWRILLNEHAGPFSGVGLAQTQQMIEELGLDAEVLVTRSAGHMTATLQAFVAQGVPRVAVAGGDGTVALAAQVLAFTDTVLAILPQGTANNFATSLRLPLDLPSALRVLQEGVVEEVDLGEVNGQYFTEAAGVGLFANALALYGEGGGKHLVRGFYAMLRVLFSARARRLTLTLDGEQRVERAVMCTVANCYRLGFSLPLAPWARLTDGELDVVLIGDLRRHELIPYYRAVRAQMHLKLPKVQLLRAKEVTIDAMRPLNVHCDDQVIGTTPVTIRVRPKALKVLVDRL